MKIFLSAIAAVALFASPAFAADVYANSTGGKPSSSASPSADSAAKNEKAYEAPGSAASPSTGAGTGVSGSAAEPTAPQEKQELRDTGESPSQHNDPGTTTSPPSPDK